MTSRTRTLTAPPSQDRPVDGQVRGVALSRERHPLPAKTTLAADDQVTLDVDPKPFMLKGFAVIILAFGGFGGWAAMAPLDSATVASGNIIVDGGRQKIQHLEGGTILEMLVNDGDQVEQGQVLLRLDPTRANASRSIVEGSYVAAKAQEARVLAELRDADDITFDQLLLANEGRADVKQILDVQRELFASRSVSWAQQIEILQTQISQLNEEIVALEAERQSKSRQLELLNDELEGAQTLLTEGLTVKTQVLELRRNHESLNGDRLSIEANIAKTRNQISEVEGKIALEKNNIQDQLIEELEEAQLKVLQAREELVSADDVLQRIDIRAPVGGLITNNNAVTVGGVVGPGDIIMEVVPTNEQLVIDARVTIQDIDSVKIGQEAGVLLTGFNQATTPTLVGEVDHVAADRQIDQATNEPYFQAKITVSEEQIARLDQNQVLRPGMPADAIIVTGERTVLQYLTKPITQILARSWREE